MGSAPARLSADARLDSTFRRGAWVGPGMPGVYAVRHAGTGGPSLAATASPWIQPPDVDYSRDYGAIAFATLTQQTHTTDSQPGQDPFPYSVRLDGDPHTITDIGVTEWHIAWDNPTDSHSSASFTLLVNPLTLFSPVAPDVGDWPPGAIGVEYETDIGYGPGVVQAAEQTLDTHAEAITGISNTTFNGGLVLHVPAADIPAAGVVLQPSDLAGFSSLVSFASGTSPVEQDLTLTTAPGDAFLFIDADQFALDLGTITYPDTAAAAITLSGFVFSGTYTPSRYRFTF